MSQLDAGPTWLQNVNRVANPPRRDVADVLADAEKAMQQFEAFETTRARDQLRQVAPELADEFDVWNDARFAVVSGQPDVEERQRRRIRTELPPDRARAAELAYNAHLRNYREAVELLSGGYGEKEPATRGSAEADERFIDAVHDVASSSHFRGIVPDRPNRSVRESLGEAFRRGLSDVGTNFIDLALSGDPEYDQQRSIKRASLAAQDTADPAAGPDAGLLRRGVTSGVRSAPAVLGGVAATLGAAAVAPASLAAGAGLAGGAAWTYTQSFPEALNEIQDLGVDRSVAMPAAAASAAIESAIEQWLPFDKQLFPQALRDGITSNARKYAMQFIKEYGKNYAKENIEEVGQALTRDAAKYVADKLTGGGRYDLPADLARQFNPEQLAEQAIAIATVMAPGAIRRGANDAVDRSMYRESENRRLRDEAISKSPQAFVQQNPEGAATLADLHDAGKPIGRRAFQRAAGFNLDTLEERIAFSRVIRDAVKSAQIPTEQDSETTTEQANAAPTPPTPDEIETAVAEAIDRDIAAPPARTDDQVEAVAPAQAETPSERPDVIDEAPQQPPVRAAPLNWFTFLRDKGVARRDAVPGSELHRQLLSEFREARRQSADVPPTQAQASTETADEIRQAQGKEEGRQSQATQEEVLAEESIEPEYTADRESSDSLSAVLGAPIRPAGGPPAYIDIDPIKGGTVRPIRELSLEGQKVFGRTVRSHKIGRRKMSGMFDPRTMQTSTLYQHDNPTAVHELAHNLDKTYQVIGGFANQPTPHPLDLELERFWVWGTPETNITRKRAEGFAVFMEKLIQNPDAVKRTAPKLYALYESRVPAEARKAISEWSTKIREWAGGTALQQIASNVANASPETVFQRMKALLEKDGYGGLEFGIWDKLNEKFLDSIGSAVKAFRWAAATRGMVPLPQANFEMLARLYSGTSSQFELAIESGWRDAAGNHVGMPFQQLLEPLLKDSQKTLDREVRNTIAVMIAQRTEEEIARWRRQGAQLVAAYSDLQIAIAAGDVAAIRRLTREVKRLRDALEYTGRGVITPMKVDDHIALKASRMTGVGFGIYSDEQQAQNAIAEASSDPAAFARYSEAARRIRELHDQLLQYQVDTGLLSAGDAAKIRANHRFYVSFAREPKTEDGALLKRFRGSTETFRNPLVSLMQQMMWTLAKGNLNRAKLSFVNMLRGDPKNEMYGAKSKLQPLTEVGHMVPESSDQTITVYDDGKPTHWLLNPHVRESINAMTSKIGSGWVFVGALPQMTRWFITHSPGFMIRNPIRDSLARYVLSEHGNMPWNVLKGIDKRAHDKAMAAGMGQFGEYHDSRDGYNKAIRNTMKRLAKDRSTILATPSRIKHAWEKLASQSETIGRVSEFVMAYKHARTKLKYDDRNATLYAAYHARSLLDYSIAGSWVRRLNQVVPFTNAMVQGLAKSYRTARKNPWSFMARLVAMSLPITVLEAFFAAAGGEDREKELHQQPAYLRDMFWNFKVGPDLWLRIPKPFELGLVSSAIGRGIALGRGDDKAFAGDGGFWRSVVQAIAPVENIVSGGAWGTIAQGLLFNYDLFRDRFIVPPYEWQAGRAFDKRPGQQYASAPARAAADVWNSAFDGSSLGLDARTIDFLVSGLTGGIGQIAVTAAKDIERQDVSATLKTASGLLVGSPGTQSRDSAWVENYLSRHNLWSNRAAKTFVRLRKEWYEAAPGPARDEAAKALRDHAAELRQGIEDGRTLRPKVTQP